MQVTLGMPASAAASHGHDSSSSPAKPGMEQDAPGIDVFTPFRFIAGRLNALSELVTVSDSKISPPQHPPKFPTEHVRPANKDGGAEGSCNASIADGPPSSADATSIRQNPAFTCRKTAYQLCHPPPQRPGRLRSRRRLLLQLRKSTQDDRSAAPVLELFSNHHLTKSLTKSRGLPSLAACDQLLICGRESDKSPRGTPRPLLRGSEDDDEEPIDPLGAVASVRPDTNAAGRPRAEIRMGPEVWQATRTATSHEFNREDEPVKARWVPKISKKRAQSDPPAPGSSLAGAATASPSAFKLVLLSPNTRQHPVVAYLDRTAIYVMDQYLVPGSAPAPSPLDAPEMTHDLARSPSIATIGSSFTAHTLTSPAAGSIITTTDAVRTFALVTGVWIALAEGWLPSCPAPTPSPPSTANPDPSPPATAPLKSGPRSASHPFTSSGLRHSATTLIPSSHTASLPNSPQFAESTFPPASRRTAESVPNSPARPAASESTAASAASQRRSRGASLINPPSPIVETISADKASPDNSGPDRALSGRHTSDGLSGSTANEGSESTRPSEDSTALKVMGVQGKGRKRDVGKRLLGMMKKGRSES